MERIAPRSLSQHRTLQAWWWALIRTALLIDSIDPGRVLIDRELGRWGMGRN